MLWRCGLQGGLLIAGLLSSGAARAATPVHVELDWTDTAGCPAPAQFDEQVARLASDAASSQAAPRFTMQVRTLPEGLELSARGRVGDRTAQRTFALASCSEVQEAAVLLVAMTLSPASFQDPSEAVAERKAAPAKTPSSRTDVGLGLSVGGSADFLTLPGVSGGPALGLQLAPGRWRVGLEARYFVPRRQAGLGDPARATVGLTSFGLATGLRWAFARFALGPQAEVECGFLRAETSGVNGGGVGRTLWLAGMLGLTAEYAVSSRITLQLAGSGGAPLLRPRFALVGEPAFFTAAPALVRVLFGVLVWIHAKD